MEEDEVNNARDSVDYGALSQSTSSFNPTLNTYLDENSFRDPSTSEEATELLVPIQSHNTSTMGQTPDQILNSFGESFITLKIYNKF